jgi:beta-lactamase regulating signal transducer with metallopeptidase domain
MNAILELGLTNAALATILAVAVAIVTRIWRHPSLVHALWLIVLLKLVTPPMVSIPWPLPSADVDSKAGVDTPLAASLNENITPLAEWLPMSEPDQVAQGSPWREGQAMSSGAAFISITEEPASTDGERAAPPQLEIVRLTWPNWQVAAISLWIAGSAVTFLVAAARLAGFHRALLQTAPAADDLQHLARTVARRLGLARPFRLRMTEARLAPLVWPIGRPTIVLSRPLIEELSNDEVRTLLAHELAHLKRKDHYVRWFELAVTILYWWHPVAWWARTMIHRAEERSCDAWTVWAFPADARRYASALFKAVQFTAENRRAVPLVASRLSAGGDLKERIEHIMNATWNRHLNWVGVVTLIMLAGLVLPLSLRGAQPASEPSAAPGNQIDSQPQQTSATDNAAQDKHSEPAASSRPYEGYEEIYRDKVRFLASQYRKAQARFNAGTGPREELELAGYELARAQAEALRGGNLGEAIFKLELAVQHADRALKALEAQHEAGQAAAESVYDTAKKLFDVRLELMHARTQQARFRPGSRPSAPPAPAPHRISPGDLLQISAIGVAPDAPIQDVFVVEPGGTVALGPTYGRVIFAGLTLEEAEKVLRDSLQKTFDSVQVQVTIPRKQQISGGGNQVKLSVLDVKPGPIDPQSAPLKKAPEGRAGIAGELVQLLQSTQSTDSISVLKTIVEANKRAYDRIQPLSASGQVSATEAAEKQAELEISIARLRQAERGLQYRKLLIALAENELQRALEANKEAPNSVPKSEVERLTIMVELAKVKYAELAD